MFDCFFYYQGGLSSSDVMTIGIRHPATGSLTHLDER